MKSERIISQFIEGFLDKYDFDMEGDLPLLDIRKNWENIVGPLCDNSYPDKLEFGNLVILSNHAAYVQELQILQLEIIKRIRKETGINIKKIKIKKGRIVAKNLFPDQYNPNYLSDNELDILDDLLKGI